MPVATSTLLGRPLWYELMTTDMKAAETFYKKIIGWTSAPFEGSPQPYTIFNRSADAPVAGVMTTPEGVTAPPFWAMYVGVPKLEEARDQIMRLGGSANLAGDRHPQDRPHADDEGPAGRRVLHLSSRPAPSSRPRRRRKSARGRGTS